MQLVLVWSAEISASTSKNVGKWNFVVLLNALKNDFLNFNNVSFQKQSPALPGKFTDLAMGLFD